MNNTTELPDLPLAERLPQLWTDSVGWVVNHTGESAIAQLRYRLKDIKFSSAEAGFKVGDKSFNAGSYVIKADGNPGDAAARIGKEAGDLGLTVTAVDKVPEVAARLGIGRTKVYELLSKGELEGVRIGGARRVPLHSVHEFVKTSVARERARVTPDVHYCAGGPT